MTTHVRRDHISEKIERRLNYIGHNKISRIELKNGDVFNKSFFKIENDSMVITNFNSETHKFVSMNELHSIVYKDRIVSMGQGALVGFLASLGPLIGGSNEPVPNIHFIIGGGILVGSTCGYLIGSNQCYKFED
jgi:hypothetical protein